MVTRDEQSLYVTMVNETFAALTQSLSEPFLEFVDELTESFMYPKGLAKSAAVLIQNHEPLKPEYVIKDDTYRFGHPILFELIALRIKITKLQKLDENAYQPIYYSSSARKKLNDSELLIRHIYKKLNHDRLVLARFRVYNDILVKSESIFDRIFKLFDSLNSIIETVVSSDKSMTLEENVQLNKQITHFNNYAKVLYNETLYESIAFRDYCEFKNIELKHEKANSALDTLELDNTNLDSFLQERKQLLHITGRRIF